jgi:glutamine synthetase
MNKIFLEYIWIDGYKSGNLRSKTKVLNWNSESQPTPLTVPIWDFDGSSTLQATGSDSERLLHPVRIYKWKNDHFFVLCEVTTIDNHPHRTNTRARLREHITAADANEYWWGFEQEYFMTKNHRIAGFPEAGYPPPQGLYYCGVGEAQVIGRELSEAHLRTCIDMGIELTGTNAEVAIGQWEYQCFAKDTLKACDDLWMSRYVLYRMGETSGYGINLNPKPISGDWNGSGCHANFSTEWMRKHSSFEQIRSLMESFEESHKTHIKVYGEGNNNRLTGLHETQHIDQFSWGVGDRGSSIRIPNKMKRNKWNGYIEDRRPASNCDPYLVAAAIINSTQASR